MVRNIIKIITNKSL